MIVYDGIINSLQTHGGISVLFNELKRRMSPDAFKYYTYNKKISSEDILLKPRLLERYRDFDVRLNNSDIFHSTYYRLPNTSSKVVTTVHDFTYEKYVGGFKTTVHSYQKNRSIVNSDKVICVSNNTAEDLIKFCPISESKIEVVYNGVSDDYHFLNLECQDYVVFVGARSLYKNFDIAISAVSKISDLKLLIVGGGSLNVSEMSLLESKLKNRFEYKGFLSNDELNSVYNQAIALIYPSEYEGFGIPVIEAQRAGCPVIAVNVSSIPEVAGDSAILIDSPKAELIYDAILMLLSGSSRKRFQTLGFENGKRFSWDKCYAETNKVYQSLK
ncbi:glycosyltransferase family 4 protein [Photobacterium leiognathi]|uniref:glycosyltransferase family 4 protein n=1 Tax=Photobacterium leiognathi TaxID=553611 RepID=UPI002981737B|nr:glycosyltransferase family 1 protein [Photobacterium leiognathi]